MTQILFYILALALGVLLTSLIFRNRISNEVEKLNTLLATKFSSNLQTSNSSTNANGDSFSIIPNLKKLEETLDHFQAPKPELKKEIPVSNEWKEKAESIQKRFDHLQVVNELGQLVTSSLNLKETFDHLYKTINSIMDASVMELGVYYWKENRWQILSNVNSSSNEEYRNHMAEWSLQNKREIFLEDAETDFSRFVFKPLVTQEGSLAQSLMSFPIIQNDKELGTITVISYRKNAFNDYHVEMLRSLIPYTAVALENSIIHQELIVTQQQLVHNEKMASIGQLSSGIAHEIINPLNFVNNFSEMSIELLTEIQESKSTEEQIQLKDQLVSNLDKINFHGHRAYNIVKNMMMLSRTGNGEPNEVNVNKTIDEFIELSYQGFQLKEKSFKCRIEKNLESKIPSKMMVGEDFGRVLLNIFTNAFYSMNEKRKKILSSTENQILQSYEPELVVKSSYLNKKTIITIRDNGLGIPDEIKNKIFLPFFTTKPTGEGTGLGLSISHDIITKGLSGDMAVSSEIGKWSELKIEFPS